MQQILLYSDSLSWGLIPGTRNRLPFEQRWPSIVENALNATGKQVRVIEDCLNGRRTVWEDPFKPGRNGQQGLAQRIEVNSPLALVILMLGTNDFQFTQPWNNAFAAAQGITALIKEIRTAPIEPGMPVPPILLVCPPSVGTPRGLIMEQKFAGAAERSTGLAAAYAQVAADLSCHFFDAGTAAATSPIDGVHLDADQHLKLGNALTPLLQSLLDAAPSTSRPA